MIHIVCSEGQYLKTHKERHDLAYALLKDRLLQYFNITLKNNDIICNVWGKPLLQNYRDMYFNISHCEGGAALSVSSCKTGIDIEKIRPFSMAAAKKVFADSELNALMASECPERVFFRLWTLKESYVKALGTGFSYPLRRVAFAVGSDMGIKCDKKGCSFRLFENELGYVTAVCYLNSGKLPDEPVVSQVLP